MSNIVQQMGVSPLIERFHHFAEDSGLAEAMGGPEALERGVQNLLQGALPLAAELMQLEMQGRDLSDAVNDPDNAPHVSRIHGFLEDFMTMKVPSELMPWARRFASSPVEEMNTVSRGIAKLALRSPNPIARALGRFLIFETLVIGQRLALRSSETSLERIGGRARDVEIIAERELKVVEASVELGDEVLEAEDPIGAMELLSMLGLTGHVQELHKELQTMTRDVGEQLRRRERILEVSEKLDPKDAVVLLNGTAEEFGEEKLSAEQLRRRHPGHLGDVSDAAVWKRTERLPGKIEKAMASDEPAGPPKGSLLEILDEVEQTHAEDAETVQ